VLLVSVFLVVLGTVWFGMSTSTPAVKRPQVSETESEAESRSGPELGGMFSEAAVAATPRPGGARAPGAQRSPPVPAAGVTRAAPTMARVVGRGPVPVDSRKYRYDRNRAQTMAALSFGATCADRMDAAEAGDILQRIHKTYGIDRETEDVIAAFDKALWLEHALNGASLMQPGRGFLRVGSSTFELHIVKQVLGADQRRFFRAYADDVADVLREVIGSYDPYDPEAAEKYGQIQQRAVERGMQKYPWLIHDSADAGVRISVEERVALIASKCLILPNAVNNADKLVERVPVVQKA